MWVPEAVLSKAQAQLAFVESRVGQKGWRFHLGVGFRPARLVLVLASQ